MSYQYKWWSAMTFWGKTAFKSLLDSASLNGDHFSMSSIVALRRAAM